MASYSVMNSGTNLVLELDYECWNEYQPAFNCIIRTKPTKGQIAKPLAQVYIPTYLIAPLIDNLNDPNSKAQVQIQNVRGITIVGRQANDFIVNGSTGVGQITLNEGQWRETINYLGMVYQFGPLAKIIGKCVRMQMINLFRQVGIDKKDVNGRFKTTPWWDQNADNIAQQNNYNNTQSFARDDASSSLPQTSNIPGGMNANPAAFNPASSMGIPSGMAMPPLPPTQQGGNSMNSGNNISMGAPMPPLPNPNGDMSMASGIQDMLSRTFSK